MKRQIAFNLLLVILVLTLAVIPLIYVQGADFGGADGEAVDLIAQINPQYQPWFHSIWAPPSGEIENLLFVLQGALGAGFVGYYLGYLKGKKILERDEHAAN